MLLVLSSDTLELIACHTHHEVNPILTSVLILAIVHSAPLRDCSDQRPCYITAYKDAEPNRGQILDWFCRNHTYEGHKGTDFGIGGFDEMDRGRPVFATAQGTVIQTADGFDDRCTSGRCDGAGGLGNHVIIAHGDGSQSRFAHLKNGSVLVSNGDQVDCSTRLGEVGSSGYSTGPHLHFEVRQNNQAVEVFAGDCGSERSLWRTQKGYRELPSMHCPITGLDDSQIIDQNLPDGSQVAPGERVEKIWTVRNVGTSQWTTEIQAVLLDDEAWNAPATLDLTRPVAPGETITVSAVLDAPAEVGEQMQLRYQLQRQGIPFGAIFWVELITATPRADAGVATDTGGRDSGPNDRVTPSAAEGCGCSQTHPQSLVIFACLLLVRRRFTSPH